MTTSDSDPRTGDFGGGLAQHHYQKALELEKQLLTSIHSKGSFDPSVRTLRNNIRELYESIILEDHEFADLHEVEQLLWRLHHTRIDDFRARIRKSMVATASAGPGGTNKPGSGGVRRDTVQKILDVFRSFLAEATGFYHDLMLKIRAKHGLPQDDFINCAVEISNHKNDDKRVLEVRRCQLSCHRCLIYLGDLARYKEYYNEVDVASHDWSIAAGFYVKAVSMSPASGNPHNQLAVLATYVGDELLAVYRYFRSLAAETPFLTAKDNLIVLFEKNRNSYLRLVTSLRDGSPHSSTVGVLEPAADGGTIKGKAKGEKQFASGSDEAKKSQMQSDEQPLERSGMAAFSAAETLKSFRVCFVRLNGILFTRTSLETFVKVHKHVLFDLKQLIKRQPREEGEGDASSSVLTAGGLWGNGPSIILQLISILIFSIHNANWSSDSSQPTYAEILQRSVISEHAFIALFDCAGCVIEHCANSGDTFMRPYLSAVLVLMEWLSCRPEMTLGTEVKEKEKKSRVLFWRVCAELLNKLLKGENRGDKKESLPAALGSMSLGVSNLTLWEDHELQGFTPLQPIHAALDFTIRPITGIGSKRDMKTRIQRIIRAGQMIASTFEETEGGLHFDAETGMFYYGSKSRRTKVREDTSTAGKFSNMEGKMDAIVEVKSLPEQIEEQRMVGKPLRQGTPEGDISLPKVSCCEEEDEVIVFRPSSAKLKEVKPESNSIILGSAVPQPKNSRTTNEAVPFQASPGSVNASTEDPAFGLSTTCAFTSTDERLRLSAGVLSHPLSSHTSVLPKLGLLVDNLSFDPAAARVDVLGPSELNNLKIKEIVNATGAHSESRPYSLGSIFASTENIQPDDLRNFNGSGSFSSGPLNSWASSNEFRMFQNQQPWTSVPAGLPWQAQIGNSFWNPELQKLDTEPKGITALRAYNTSGPESRFSLTDVLQGDSALVPVKSLEASSMLPNTLLNDLPAGASSSDVHDLQKPRPDSDIASDVSKVFHREEETAPHQTAHIESLFATTANTAVNHVSGSFLDVEKPLRRAPGQFAGMRPPPGFGPIPGKPPVISTYPPSRVSTDKQLVGTSGRPKTSVDSSLPISVYDDYGWLDGYTPPLATTQITNLWQNKSGSDSSADYGIYPSLVNEVTASPFPGMKLSPPPMLQQQGQVYHLQQELAKRQQFLEEHQRQQAQQLYNAQLLAQRDQRYHPEEQQQQQMPPVSWPHPPQLMTLQQQQLPQIPWPAPNSFMP